MFLKRLSILLALSLALLGLATMLDIFTTTAAPTVITVDTLADENDTCAVGGCSLREAIAEADLGDTIDFSVSGKIDISGNGELAINKSLTIQSTLPITISGGNATRVFNLTAGNIIFDGLTITDGNVQTDDCGSSSTQCGGGIMIQNSGVTLTLTNSTISSNLADYGGGIRIHEGTLTVNNSVISSNSANYGGGINNFQGTLTVNNSTISSNSADYGGGIYNFQGELTIEHSTIFDNLATRGGGIAIGGIYSLAMVINNSILSNNLASDLGGGISNHSTTNLVVNNSILSGNSADSGGGISNTNFGSLTINNSTLSENSATNGGGIFNNDNSTMLIYNSTLSDNSADTNGGGIFNIEEDSILIVENSSFSANSASYGGGISNTYFGTLTVNNSTFSDNTGNTGAGIFNLYGNAFHLQNTILANAIGAEDCYSSETLSTDANNLIEVNDGCGTPVSNADPQLAPLADNGGSTLTHALPPSSPAINAGDPDFTSPPDYDQRGPGYPRVVDGRIDIGAFEYSPPLNEIYLPILVAPGNP